MLVTPPTEGASRTGRHAQHHRFRQIGIPWHQSVGKAEYRPAKPFGFGSLSHRAGDAVASNVTMRPFLSRALVKKSHIVTFASS
jgi:hypothetical protein